MVIIDLLVLVIFTTVVGIGHLTLVEVVPHKEYPSSEQGVRNATVHDELTGPVLTESTVINFVLSLACT